MVDENLSHASVLCEHMASVMFVCHVIFAHGFLFVCVPCALLSVSRLGPAPCSVARVAVFQTIMLFWKCSCGKNYRAAGYFKMSVNNMYKLDLIFISAGFESALGWTISGNWQPCPFNFWELATLPLVTSLLVHFSHLLSLHSSFPFIFILPVFSVLCQFIVSIQPISSHNDSLLLKTQNTIHWWHLLVKNV